MNAIVAYVKYQLLVALSDLEPRCAENIAMALAVGPEEQSSSEEECMTLEDVKAEDDEDALFQNLWFVSLSRSPRVWEL